jgi:hypothetical protein
MTNNVRFTFSVRYVGVIQLLFSIRPLDLIGMWFSEDQRANTIKTHVQKRLDYLFKYYQLSHIQ